ncbi:MAG: MerR family transcriptional regulator [bacterium]
MSIAEVLTIAALERETQVSRSTIHFYVREGLLPQPQKTAASRSLYCEDHVKLLRKIGELKSAGHSLAEIKIVLDEDLAIARENCMDLAGQESERIRRAILRVATGEFAAKGYERTHIAAIIRELGITPQIFYSHFPSKLQLLVEAFHTFISWNLQFIEPKLMASTDQGERLLWRLVADSRANEFGSDVFSHIRSEGGHKKSDKLKLAEQAWAGIVSRITMDFESVRAPGSPPPAIPLELLAYSMIGAHHNASARASWDEKYSRADTLRTHLWLWLAALAALSGEVDIDSRIARYEGLIQEVAAREPETPPAIED